MTSPRTFSAADRRRFTAIKDELHRRLPDTQPRSEAVYHCAQLFVEVRDKDYQEMDGHKQAEPWMKQVFKVGARQAQKWFATATLPAEEVQGKHQGVEVTGQIGAEKDAKVRAAMWELTEKKGCPLPRCALGG